MAPSRRRDAATPSPEPETRRRKSERGRSSRDGDADPGSRDKRSGDRRSSGEDSGSDGGLRHRESKESRHHRQRAEDPSSDKDGVSRRDDRPKRSERKGPDDARSTRRRENYKEKSRGDSDRDPEEPKQRQPREAAASGEDSGSDTRLRRRESKESRHHRQRPEDPSSGKDGNRRRDDRSKRSERKRPDDARSPPRRENHKEKSRGDSDRDPEEPKQRHPREAAASGEDSGSDTHLRRLESKESRHHRRRGDDRSSEEDSHRRRDDLSKRRERKRPDGDRSPRRQENHKEPDRDLEEPKQKREDPREAAAGVPVPDARGHRRSSGEDSGSDGRHHKRRSDDRNSDDEDGRRRGSRVRKRERKRSRSPHRRETHKERSGRDTDRDPEEPKQRREDPREATAAIPPPPPLPPMPDAMAGRSSGIYIPPFLMARMMSKVEDKSSEEYQRLSWDALRKSINGLVNKVNATNIKNIIPELMSENLIRGRGLFCRSCMKSQMASPGFTDVFAGLVAVVNTKFPEVGNLLVRRIVLQLKRAYKRNDKPQLLAATKFIAHLVNQQVTHEIIALELLTILLENPTDDSVEVAVGFVKECGALLQDFSPQGLHGIFERFRGILHEGEIDKRVQFLIEGLFAVRKAKFQGFPAIRGELDLVDQEDQFTHEISLEDEIDPETNLDVFKANPRFLEDEKAYEDVKNSILGPNSSEDEDSDVASGDEDEEESEDEDEEMMEIKDETETNLVNLRRTIYLTIMSSVDFEEAGHKLLKIKLEPGQEMELCIMLLECCSQERTYLRYYGLLGQRFCLINKIHQENFEKCFVQQYSMIHRLETNKLRNVAKFFAHLLGTSALPWHVLAYIRLTEEETTSSSRIFIKILFQELSEHLGIRLLNERLNDPSMQDSFDSIFPKDNPKNTRFSINFFTSIGLGGITESLREYLKNMPRLIMEQQKPVPDSDGETGSSSSSGSGSDSSSESESESSSDDGRRNKRKRRRN